MIIRIIIVNSITLDKVLFINFFVCNFFVYIKNIKLNILLIIKLICSSIKLIKLSFVFSVIFHGKIINKK